MRELEPPRSCNDCGALPGDRHERACDVARCVSTGQQYWVCPGQEHIYDGRWYGEHEGVCKPSRHDGYYPGVLQCRALNMFTPENSMFGGAEDLNGLSQLITGWDDDRMEYTLRS